MKSRILTLALILLAATAVVAEEIPDDTKIRDSIPLGGDFQPNPKVGAFVVVGHGARIIVSKDDGQTWKQAFFAAPGADHGPWATKSVAYTSGVFAVPVGWGGPTIFLASDDAVNWRHLTSGAAKLPDAKGDPRLMPGTWGLAGGNGVFVSSGYMTFSATADLGKSFNSFAMWGKFKDDPRGKMSTHHISTVYCGDASGRFLALGDNRGDSVMTDTMAANAWTSVDAGETWDGPNATGTQRASLSVVNGEFWLCGKHSRASGDGKTWRDLHSAVPEGQVIASDKGTLISIHPKRFNIQRSTDGGETWQEVHSFVPADIKGGAQGLRDGVFGLVAP
jgi:BNR/Asp-box repeat